MKAHDPTSCTGCGAEYVKTDPFCVQCGAVLPSAVSRGGFSVELSDVPSEEMRGDAVKVLKKWFPQLDSLELAEQLKAGRSVLIAGIDEESGARILDALKPMKVGGRLIRSGQKQTDSRSLLFGSLGISAISLVAAILFFGPLSLLFILIAIVSGVVAALSARGRSEPLIDAAAGHPEDEDWIKLAQEYGQEIGRLAPEYATQVKSLARMVLDVRGRLRSDSLAASAAGKTRGDLYQRIKDALTTALHIAERLGSEQSEHSSELKEELDALTLAVQKTAEMFRNLDTEGVKEAPALAREMQDITESVDRIVQEVRSPETVRPVPRRKTPA